MLTSGKSWIFGLLGAFLACLSTGAQAQILGGLGLPGVGVPLGLPPVSGTPTLPIPSLPSVGNLGNGLQVSPFAPVDSIGRPIDQRVIAFDSIGQPIVRGEVLAIAPTEADLDVARSLNFTLRRPETLSALGVELVSLRAPNGMDSVAALAVLRHADPAGNFDFDHLYSPSGSDAVTAGAIPALRGRTDARGISIGMIDAGVYRGHRALAHGDVIVRNVTGNDRYVVTAHGTAVASLLVGDDDTFHGELPGATLYAADAFGADPTGGSALDIARALDWLARKGVVVVNASLAGPPNALLAAAVRSFLASGHVLVAAAGNGGPAAPPAYPAAYDGVVGVTSVDSQHHVQLDATRGNVSFAALGVDVRAAALDVDYRAYTGTSFAAPVVAAHFATLIASPDPAAARAARDALARSAERLGNMSAYGFGYVGPVSASLASR